MAGEVVLMEDGARDTLRTPLHAFGETDDCVQLRFDLVLLANPLDSLGVDRVAVPLCLSSQTGLEQRFQRSEIARVVGGDETFDFSLAEQIGIHQPHDPTVPEFTQPIPDSLADWIDTVPQMVSQPGPNYAGEGYSAMSWDISIDPTAGETFACDYRDCVGVPVHEDAGVFVMGDDFSFRLWQFEGAGDLLGSGQAPLDGLEHAEAFYQMGLDGLSISE